MRQPKQQPFAPRLSIQKLTKSSQNLRKLIQQAEKQSSLNEQLNASLPKLFQGQFQINSLKGHTLMLTCHSASLMTRFRFTQNDTIRQFNKLIHPNHINEIKIRIRPKHYNQSTQSSDQKSIHTKNSNKVISKKNAQILNEEAEHTDDIKLKNILLRLAKHSA